MSHFDLLEIREPEERVAEQFAELRRVLEFALPFAPGLARHLAGAEIGRLDGPDDLLRLPVLRKSDLLELQAADPPLAGFATRMAAHYKHLFMSPGPFFAPGGDSRDWWRMGRFLHAASIGMGDIVQNGFSYHMTPAGLIFESAIAAVSATCVPTGNGPVEEQVQAASRLGVTAWVGPADTLIRVLDAAHSMKTPLAITRAAVGGTRLPHDLWEACAALGISCLQCYFTADLGNIAYETAPGSGMVVDEGVILEILDPETLKPVPAGEIGEVVVTSLNPDYPLVRFATGDLSAFQSGPSACGRTGPRLRGVVGRTKWRRPGSAPR